MKIEITPELLASLKEKAGQATQGEWSNDESGYVFRKPQGSSEEGQMPIVLLGRTWKQAEQGKLDGAFIAAANPAVMLAMIEKIEQLEKEADWLVDKMNDCPEQMDGKYCPYDDTEFLPLNILPIIPKWVCKKCWRNAAKEAIKEQNI